MQEEITPLPDQPTPLEIVDAIQQLQRILLQQRLTEEAILYRLDALEASDEI